MNINLLFSCVVFVGLSLTSSFATAEPVVETGDRAEVNWSGLEVRYFGEAAPDESEKDSFKGAERRAWQDGTAAIEETLQLLGKGRIGMHVSAPRGAAGSGGSRATSRSTTYFGDGKVRVYLQSPLQQVVTAALGEVSFHSPMESRSESRSDKNSSDNANSYTGVVLELGSKAPPMAVYKVTDANGEKLFGLEDMTEAGFKSNLMGRWFRKASPSEIAPHVGSNPLTLKGKHDPNSNKIVVDRQAWEASGVEIAALIATGRIVISIP